MQYFTRHGCLLFSLMSFLWDCGLAELLGSFIDTAPLLNGSPHQEPAHGMAQLTKYGSPCMAHQVWLSHVWKAA